MAQISPVRQPVSNVNRKTFWIFLVKLEVLSHFKNILNSRWSNALVPLLLVSLTVVIFSVSFANNAGFTKFSSNLSNPIAKRYAAIHSLRTLPAWTLAPRSLTILVMCSAISFLVIDEASLAPNGITTSLYNVRLTSSCPLGFLAPTIKRPFSL